MKNMDEFVFQLFFFFSKMGNYIKFTYVLSISVYLDFKISWRSRIHPSDYIYIYNIYIYI